MIGVIILDIIGNYFSQTLFTFSYIISISKIIKYKFNRKLYFIIFISFIYDLIFTDRLFLHTFIFLLISLLIRKYRKSNIYILGLVSLIIYYLIMSIYSFRFNIYNMVNFITINYFIFLLTYFITNRIYNIRWWYGGGNIKI